MARKSYRDLYKAIKKIPSDLKTTLQNIVATNQRRVIELLMKNPLETTVGEYNKKDREVHFKELQAWELEGKLCYVNSVPQISVVSVVVGMNAILKRNNLPYAVWSECRIGNPLNRKGKIRLYKNEAPFKIGLVNKRQPIKPDD